MSSNKNKIDIQTTKEYRLILGALKQSINAHGPVDLKNYSSAAKRLYGILYRENKNES